MSKSETYFEIAKKYIPGGVNSPVRAFNGVDGSPLFFNKGEGAYLYDADENKYIDYVGSWGPLILGHCDPQVIHAVEKALCNGMSFGAPTELEIELAELICKLMPSIELVRMVNSGTEATMTAIRLARAHTKRNKIIKFNGCYHGHSDSLLVKAGSGLLTLGIPATPGVPESVVKHTLTADYNNFPDVEELFTKYADDIAAVIIEPIAGNMGFVEPEANFLQNLREICTKNNSVLIFDEVMTGFRVALGGAQSLYDIKPDLTTLGKVIGGGMPVGALGGKREIMSKLAPQGDVYQAGTLSGNPLAMAAGAATLKKIAKPEFFNNLNNVTQTLVTAFKNASNDTKIPIFASSVGAMFGFCFTDKEKLCNFADVSSADNKTFRRFYHAMLKRGVYFAPSMFEAGFVSSAHTIADIENTGEAIRRALTEIKNVEVV